MNRSVSFLRCSVHAGENPCNIDPASRRGGGSRSPLALAASGFFNAWIPPRPQPLPVHVVGISPLPRSPDARGSRPGKAMASMAKAAAFVPAARYGRRIAAPVRRYRCCVGASVHRCIGAAGLFRCGIHVALRPVPTRAADRPVAEERSGAGDADAHPRPHTTPRASSSEAPTGKGMCVTDSTGCLPSRGMAPQAICRAGTPACLRPCAFGGDDRVRLRGGVPSRWQGDWRASGGFARRLAAPAGPNAGAHRYRRPFAQPA